MSYVQDVVKEKQGILLRSEVCLLGFDEDIAARFADPRHHDVDRVAASQELSLLMGEQHE